jgi:transposase-like protein
MSQVSRYLSSGLSMKEFAELEGIARTTLHNWVAKYRRENGAGGKAPRKDTVQQGFAKLEIPAGAPKEAPSPLSTSHIIIRYPNGTEVHIPMP